MKSVSTMKTVLSLLVGTALSIALFVAPAAAQAEDARIHLIHAIPGIEVDVLVDGQRVYENFKFEETQDLSSLAGETLVGLRVNLSGTEETAIDAGDIALPARGNHSVIAHLDADGNPALNVFTNDTSTIDAGKGRLIVRHAAGAPAVDIKVNGTVAFSAVANGAENTADLPAGTVNLEVVPTGADEPAVIGPADLPVIEGSALIVYAVGSIDDGVQVISESINGLGDTPALLNTGNSPIKTDSPYRSLVWVGLALIAIGGASVAVKHKAKA